MRGKKLIEEYYWVVVEAGIQIISFLKITYSMR